MNLMNVHIRLIIWSLAACCALSVTNASGQDSPEEAPPTALETKVAELEAKIDLAKTQTQNSLNRKSELAREKELATQELDDFRVQGPAETPPFSFLLVDRTRDELSSQEVRLETVKSTVEVARTILQDFKENLDSAERIVRLAKDSLAGAEASRRAELSNDLKLAQLEVLLNKELVRFAAAEVANEEGAQEIAELRLTLLEERYAIYKTDVRFEKAELEKMQAEVEAVAEELKNQRALAGQELSRRQNEWSRAAAKKGSEPPTADEQQRIESLSLWRDAARREILLLTESQQRAEEKKTIWSRRYDIANGINETEWVDWVDESEDELEALAKTERWESSRISDLRSEISSRKTEVGAAEVEAESPWRQSQIDALRTQIEAYEEDLIRLEAHQRLHSKLAADAREALGGRSLSAFLAFAWTRISQGWNYELAKFDDSPITVGKVILCVVLIFFGYFFARWIASLLGRFIFPRLGVNDKAAAPMRSIVFYALLFTVVLVAFRIVNVPLTVFTVAGGAIAIGIGFGSQNVMNNFISGLILLAERPIRIGDLVQLDDTLGTITHIGARSTKVKTPSNQEVIVPNSQFLENRVINWTLADHMVRTHVSVGVAYGSPARRVSDLMLKAAKEHEKVLLAPTPFVLFREFGDNSLVFEVYFWIYMNTHAERLQAESDIRFVLDRLFRDANIVISFPQRDLHLDTTSPLEIRLRNDAPET